MSDKKKKDLWSSKLGFILAAVGSAVGLGNLWKFPYITYENGGGAFVIFYLICILVVGLPIMIAELLIGKLAKKDPISSFEVLRPKKSRYKIIGIIGVLSGFIILSYYSVVAGWTAEYSVKSVMNSFNKEVPKEFKNKILVKNYKKDQVEFLVKKEKESQTYAKLDKLPEMQKEYVKILYKLKTKYVEKEFAKDKEKLTAKIISDYEKIENKKTVNETIKAKYIESLFGTFLQNPWKLIGWHTLFMFICIFIVMKGISGGIEKYSKVLMPILAFFMLVLLINSFFIHNGAFAKSVKFLFDFDFSKLTQEAMLEAMGHAFFTLSLGMGAILTYGSYLSDKEDITSAGFLITILDTLVALVACLIIYPIIFGYNLHPESSGIGILFTTLPFIFTKMTGGYFISIVFYLLVAFAAITSIISLLEVCTAFAINKFKMERSKATFVTGIVIYLIGIPSALSFNLLGKDKLTVIGGRNFFDSFDYLASNWLLPIGGFLIAVFVAFILSDKEKVKEFRVYYQKFTGLLFLENRNNEVVEYRFNKIFMLWNFSIKHIAPIAVFFVILKSIGLI